MKVFIILNILLCTAISQAGEKLKFDADGQETNYSAVLSIKNSEVRNSFEAMTWSKNSLELRADYDSKVTFSGFEKFLSTSCDAKVNELQTIWKIFGYHYIFIVSNANGYEVKGADSSCVCTDLWLHLRNPLCLFLIHDIGTIDFKKN